MPSAIRQNHELADKGLVSILVESQGADTKKLESFLWQRFPDNDCFATTGCFVPIPESRGIPHGAVVGVDGKLLWAGNPIRDKAKIEELVKQQLKLVKKGWGDSAEARKVRAALYGRGNFAAAVAVLKAMDDGDEKSMLQKEVDVRYAINKAAIDNLKQQGYWLQAQAAAKSLLKGVGRDPEWSVEAAKAVAAFEAPEAKAEIAADKKLAKVLKSMRKGKLDKAPKALKKLISKIGQSSVGARASRTLASLEG